MIYLIEDAVWRHNHMDHLSHIIKKICEGVSEFSKKIALDRMKKSLVNAMDCTTGQTSVLLNDTP